MINSCWSPWGISICLSGLLTWGLNFICLGVVICSSLLTDSWQWVYVGYQLQCQCWAGGHTGAQIMAMCKNLSNKNDTRVGSEPMHRVLWSVLVVTLWDSASAQLHSLALVLQLHPLAPCRGIFKSHQKDVHRWLMGKTFSRRPWWLLMATGNWKKENWGCQGEQNMMLTTVHYLLSIVAHGPMKTRKHWFGDFNIGLAVRPWLKFARNFRCFNCGVTKWRLEKRPQFQKLPSACPVKIRPLLTHLKLSTQSHCFILENMGLNPCLGPVPAISPL